MLGLPETRPVDPVLTNFMLDFSQAETDFVADLVFPFVQTPGDTGTYYIPDAKGTLRAEEALWGFNVGANRRDLRYTSAAFKARKFGFELLVTDDDRRNWMGGMSLDQQAANQNAQDILLAREVRAEGIVDAGSYTTSAAGNTWTGTSANPRSNVNAAQAIIHKKIGKKGNLVIIPGAVWDSLTGTQVAGTGGAQVLEAIKYTKGGLGSQLTAELMAQYFNVNKVGPGVAVQQDPTKHESSASPTVGLPETGIYIWDQTEVYVMYCDPTPAQKSTNYGASFGNEKYAADSYRDNRVQGDWIRGWQVLNETEVCTASIVVITGV